MRINCKLPDLIEQRGIDKKTLCDQAMVNPKTITDYCRSSVKRYSEETLTKLYRYFNLTSLSQLIDIED